jgi:Tyrosine-protein kinase ephrin type A/B receptor-like
MNTMYRVLILFSVYLRVFTVVTAQEPCPAGQFRSGEYCEMCPWGKFSEVSGATSAETCLFCEPGQYSDDPGGGAAWTRCLPCPGNSSSDPVRLSQNIVGGETDTRAQTQCACNVGYAQNEEYRNYELSEQLGYRVYNDLCVPCYAGTYQPQSLQFSMRSLAYMQYHWQTGEPTWSGSCIPCPDGKVATPGSAYCKCPQGYAGSHDGPCTLCGEGFYSRPQGNITVCDACPEGTVAENISGVWTCATVQAAETTAAETTPPETTPSETTLPETTTAESTLPETTPAETTSAESTLPETTAAETPAATTTPEASIDTTPESSPEITPEPSVQTISTTPSPKSFYPLSCIACPAGFFLSQESLNCTLCPPGSSTHDFSNASSALDCICMPGFDNQTEACQLCREGFYKPSLENTSCSSCPANSNTAAPGATDVAECVCKPGFTRRWLESNSSTSDASPVATLAPTTQTKWTNLLSCNKTSVANVKNMPRYYTDGDYFHTKPTSQAQVLSFENVPMDVSTSFKVFMRYKVVSFNSNYDIWFYIRNTGIGEILQLYRYDVSQKETVLWTPTGRINPTHGTGTIPNPWANVWTNVMIDWQKETGKWKVSWNFNCTAECGACSSACTRSSSATASGTLTSFYSGPYTFRVGGGNSGVGFADLHVSHVLVSNQADATWPTFEELTCKTTPQISPETTTKVSTTSLSNSSIYNESVADGLANDCVACPAGTFKSPLGNGACALCPADHYCPLASAEPRACPPRSSSLPGSGSPEACLCADGFVLFPSNNSYKCEECYADSYYGRDPTTSVGICIPCQFGAGSLPGSRSARDCICKPGFVVEPDTTEYTCSACNPGTYSAAANASVCDACAPGTFTGTTATVQCTACASGSVALDPGMSACVPCPASSWQNVDDPGSLSKPCSPCPANSGHELTGVYDVFQCTCTAGLYKVPNGTRFDCSECEPGYICGPNAVTVTMELTLGLPLTVETFTPALQEDFREAIAATVDVDVSRVLITSISEKEASRRLLFFLRRLLSDGIVVEFQILLDRTTNVTALEPPTVEEINQEIEIRDLTPVEVLVAPVIVVIQQREICPSTSFCEGADNVYECRPFSTAPRGASTQEQCLCNPGFYSLNTSSACNKCPPGNYCPGGLLVESCAPNSTSAPGAGSAEGCYCRDGHWRGCTRTNSGALINNTGLPCAINFTAPCVMCRANDICFNDTLLHCPDHSTSPPGSSKPSHCVCDGGFAVEYF